MRKTSLLIISLLVFFTTYSGVNLKNGNFYISYMDIVVKTENSVLKDISRTYNSKALGEGFFGKGWGSPLETRLYFYPDNTIVVAENGSGRKNFFSPELYNEDDLNKMIYNISQKAIEKKRIEDSPSSIMNFKSKIKNNQELRVLHYNNLFDNYLEDNNLIDEDMVWRSNSIENQVIIKIEKGFIRKKLDGLVEVFDYYGRLISMSYEDGRNTSFSYQDGKLVQIILGEEVVDVEMNEKGLITKFMLGESKATYKYDKEQRLIESRDMEDNVYGFEYDKNYNMTKIIYTDMDPMIMTYEPKTLFISSIKYPNKKREKYEYPSFYKEDGSEDPDHYATSVFYFDKDSILVDKNYAEFQIKIQPNGERYTSLEISENLRNRDEKHYDDICTNNAKLMIHNGDSTFYYFNKFCQLTKKITPNKEEILFSYRGEDDLIAKYDSIGFIVNYEYDRANLISATTNDNFNIEFAYSAEDKIKSMVINKENRYTIVYDEQSKFSQIINEKGDTLKFSYNSDDELSFLEGSKMELHRLKTYFEKIKLMTYSNWTSKYKACGCEHVKNSFYTVLTDILKLEEL